MTAVLVPEHLLGLSAAPSEHTWENVARRDFDLTPRELATLAAIVAYVSVNGRPMPKAELQRLCVEDDHPQAPEPSMTTPGRLFHEGLILLVGPREHRCYDATVAGLRRLER